MARKKISNRLAVAIWERDCGRCFYCGGILHPEDIEFDHDIPLSKGGETEYENLKLACARCNGEKGTMYGYEYLEISRFGG